MDRAGRNTELAGVAIALAGHVGLVALLSLHLMKPPPLPSTEQPITVSLVEDVGIQQSAPPAPEPPSASQAPEQGAPEEAAAPAEPAPVPKPAPPKAEPKPEPVKPKPAPAKPEPKPEPVKAKPETKPKAESKPQSEPKPRTEPKAEPKPAAKPSPAAAAAKPRPDRLAGVVSDAIRADAARSAAAPRGTSATAAAPRPRGSRLGNDFLKGLADTPSKASPSTAAPGAMSVKALADISSIITRQVQPCANRQVNPGPGAERIRVTLNLKLNRDGSLGAPPRVINHDGIDTENRRYLDRVDDLAIATFTGCAPLRGLPGDLYDVPNGWRSFTLRYKLPD